MKILKPEQRKSKSIEIIFPKDQQNNEIKKELSQIKIIEEQIDRKGLICEIVHELDPKKWVFHSGGWTKCDIVF